LATAIEQETAQALLHARHLAAYQWAQAFVAGQRVLDIGPNRGYGSKILAPAARLLVAVDLDLAMAREASRAARIPAVQANGEELPFPDAAFDRVVAFQVVEHVWDDRRFLSEILRVLRPGGLFLLSTPHRQGRLLWNQMPWNEEHLREYGIEEWHTLLDGFPAETQELDMHALREAAAWERRRVHQDPWSHFLPGLGWGPVRRAARIMDNLFRRPSPLIPLAPRTSLTDFFQVGLTNLDRAHDLMAIGRREEGLIKAQRQAFVPVDYWSDRHRRFPGLLGTGTLGAPGRWQQWLYRGKTRAFRRLLKKQFVLPLRGSVLNFGCGNGFFESIWESWGASRCDGIDLVKEIVDELKLLYPHRRYLAADLSADPATVKDWGPYTLITGIDVFYHLTDDAVLLNTLKALRATATPSGWLLLTDQFFDRRPAPHVRFRSLNQWRQILKRIDAELVALEPVFVFQNRPSPLSRWVPGLTGAGSLAIDLAARQMFPWAANNRALLARFR
jgi:SAM-dependent methyltransferase